MEDRKDLDVGAAANQKLSLWGNPQKGNQTVNCSAMTGQLLSFEDQALWRQLGSSVELYRVYRDHPEEFAVDELFNIGITLRGVIAGVEKKREEDSVPAFQREAVDWRLGQAKEFRALIVRVLGGQTSRRKA